MAFLSRIIIISERLLNNYLLLLCLHLTFQVMSKLYETLHFRIIFYLSYIIFFKGVFITIIFRMINFVPVGPNKILRNSYIFSTKYNCHLHLNFKVTISQRCLTYDLSIPHEVDNKQPAWENGEW